MLEQWKSLHWCERADGSVRFIGVEQWCFEWSRKQ
jgi:hypothetical protein